MESFYDVLNEQFKEERKVLAMRYWHRLEAQQQRIFGLLSYFPENAYIPAERLYFQINAKMLDVLMNIKLKSD